jgi:uncharacterized protein (DUF305 family)
MKKFIIPAFLFLLSTTGGMTAQAALEPGYNPGPRLGTPWYGYVGAAERAADLDFIKGMRPHHAGALTMSDEYLNDRDARNPALKSLAEGIIRNQTFEIGMLDKVETFMQPPAPEGTRSLRQIAVKDLGQRQKFIRSVSPSHLAQRMEAQDVSVRDVQFAKAMIVHHQAALDMAHDYLADPAARNGYLELMCLDILVDQSQEIALMHAIIHNYKGNADAIKIDDSMVHGMEGMKHGGKQGAQHKGHTPAPKKAVKKAAPAKADPHAGHH